MSAAAKETFLAALYADPKALERFLADPKAEAARHGLDEAELGALAAVDLDGLELAGKSFARKREKKRAHAGHARARSWLERLKRAVGFPAGRSATGL